jgi:hypothetical protein
MSFLLSLIFSLQQNWRREREREVGGEMAQTRYAHMNKLLNNKKIVDHGYMMKPPSSYQKSDTPQLPGHRSS